MPLHPIVRDPSVVGGRWRFDGMPILVEAVRQDYQRDPEASRIAYSRLGLSDEDIQAALDFVFPAVGEPTIEVQFMTCTITCACGHTRSHVLDGTSLTTEPCRCGRTCHVVARISEAEA
jgi:uncharacterized protein (DUF433 family)